MLVDDEPIVRTGLRSIIARDAQYAVVCEADNGEQALALYDQYKPDIIFVDIMTPVMNGFELIRRIKQKAARSKFIILSCMDDKISFKEAISVGVSEYILKHSASQEEIISILASVSETIRKERVFDQEEDEGEEYINHNIVLSQFLNLVFAKKIDDSLHIRNKLEQYGIPTQGRCFFVAVLTADESEIAARKTNPLTTLSSLVIGNIRSIADGYIFENYQSRVTMLAVMRQTEAAPVVLADLCRSICDISLQCLDIHVTLGVSARHDDWGMLPDAYRQAVDALSAVYIHGHGQLYTYREATPSAHYRDELESLTKELVKLTSPLDASALKALISKISRAVRGEPGVRYDAIKDTLAMIWYHLDSLAVAAGINPADFSMKKMCIDQLYQSGVMLDIFAGNMNRYLDWLAETCREQAQSKVIHYARFAREYVDSKIPSKITLKEIADFLHISEGHLCRIFRQDEGMSLFDYIKRKRIWYAKTCLIRCGCVTQASYAAGFSTESYFVKVFKEIEHMTPGTFLKHARARQHDA
jgi:CheY-like chemotaxis protein/AraC-like DNA-binding protein